MKNSLELYVVYSVLNLLLLSIGVKWLFTSVLECDYIGVLLWSFVVSVDLNDIVNKQRNFVKYYPHFEDKWLKFF